MISLRPGELSIVRFTSVFRHALEFAGELDLNTSGSLLEAVAAPLDGDEREIVLDLRGLQLLDSAGLRAVVQAWQRSRDAGRALTVVSARGGPAHTLFEIAGLTERLPLRDGDRAGDPDDEMPLEVESIVETPQLTGGASARRLTIRIDGATPVRTMTVAGELDSATAPALLRAVGRHCALGAQRVALELGALTRVGPDGAQALAVAAEICACRKCRLEVTPPSAAPCRAVLEEAGVLAPLPQERVMRRELLELERLDTGDGTHTVRLRGDLGLSTVPRFEEHVRPLCENGTRALTLDLGPLDFIDSTGLAAIVLAGRVCAKHGVDFAILPGRSSVQKLFEFSGLFEALPFRKTGPAGAG